MQAAAEMSRRSIGEYSKGIQGDSGALNQGTVMGGGGRNDCTMSVRENTGSTAEEPSVSSRLNGNMGIRPELIVFERHNLTFRIYPINRLVSEGFWGRFFYFANSGLRGTT